MRKKLFISFMLLILIPTALLGTYSYYVSKLNMLRQTQLAMESNAQSIAYGLDNSIGREDDNMRYLVYNMTLNGVLESMSDDRKASEAMLHENLDPNLEYYMTADDNIFNLSVSTEAVDGALGDFVREPETIQEKLWYDETGSDFQTLWKIDEDHHIQLVRAVLDRETQSKRTGMLIMTLDRENFFSLVDRSIYQGNGLFILDADGEVVRSKPLADMGLDAQVLKDIKAGYIQEGYQNNGSYMLVATAPISNGWTVYYYIGKNVISQTTGRMLGSTMLLIGATLLVAMFLVYFFSDSLSVRIRGLQQMAEKVRDGDYDIPYSEDETDEIGSVGRSLHDMAGQIQELIQETDARRVRDVGQSRTDLQYREWLFDFVVERNRDIAAIFTAEDFSAQFVSANAGNNLGISQDSIQFDIRTVMDAFPGGISLLNKDVIRRMGIGEVLEADELEGVNPRTGEHRWYRGLVTRTDYNDGRSFVLVLYDRTEELSRNHQLEESIEIARSANEAKTNFLANMSHDFRTPMNAIVNFNLLIDRNAEDEVKVREYSRKIEMSCKSLQMLLDDVLDMSKIESGKTSLVQEEFSLNSLLEEVNSVMGEEASGKNITYRPEYSDMGHDVFIGDSGRINEVLINLLGNAVKYTPSGGEVEFKTEGKKTGNNGYWDIRFTVKDNGVGMSEEFQKNIFVPFAREVKDSTRGIEGTGLGMPITRNLVELMGGAISLESKEGVGSTFVVTLRLQEAGEGAAEKKEDESTEEAYEILRGANILAAEDNDINADILQELLALFDAKMERAVDGKEVLERFRSSRPGTYDMILMDIQMPEMNGYEATEAIRALERPDADTLPIVAMTANAYADDIQRAYDAGMDAHISKPVDLKILEKTIMNIGGLKGRKG